MEGKHHVGHAAVALVAVTHKRSGAGANLRGLALSEIAVGRTLIERRAEVVGVRAAGVMAEFVGKHHHVPVLPVVVHQRRWEVAREVAANAEAVVGADRIEPRDAAAEGARTQKVRDIAADARHVGDPVAAKLGQLRAGRGLKPRIGSRPEAAVGQTELHARIAAVHLVGARNQRLHITERGRGVAAETVEEFLVGVDGNIDRAAVGKEGGVTGEGRRFAVAAIAVTRMIGGHGERLASERRPGDLAKRRA